MGIAGVTSLADTATKVPAVKSRAGMEGETREAPALVWNEVFCSGQPLDGEWGPRARSLVKEPGEGERLVMVAEFQRRMVELGERLEGLMESSLMHQEAFLLRFLRGANWDVEEAVRLISNSHA